MFCHVLEDFKDLERFILNVIDVLLCVQEVVTHFI